MDSFCDKLPYSLCLRRCLTAIVMAGKDRKAGHFMVAMGAAGLGMGGAGGFFASEAGDENSL